MDTQTREQWLNKSAQILFDVVLTPEVLQDNPPPPVRVSVAPMRSKELGCCHPRASSEDAHNEIFITAHIDDSQVILATLTHELIHAADDCQSGHRNFFAKAARLAGLEGKLTSTMAGAQLSDVLENIVGILGPIPHAKLHLKPKSKGRNNNKLICKACGFQANLSRKWADQAAQAPWALTCPCCDSLTLKVQFSY